MLELLPLAAVLMLSPGPANLATLALAARHGLAGVGPFVFGIAIGYAAVAAAIAWLGGRFLGESALGLLPLAGGLFLGYLGWRLIARAGRWNEADGRPCFLSGLALQLLNPKFPAVVLTVLAANGSGHPWSAVATLVGMGVAGLGLYATLGATSHRFVQRPSGRAWCDRMFGLLLMLTGVWLAAEGLLNSRPASG